MIVDKGEIAAKMMKDAEPDMVEVIRCRDCKFHAGENNAGVHHELCFQFNALTIDDGYCAWAELKDD